MALLATSFDVSQPRGKAALALACAVGLVALSGASCPQIVRQYKLPIVRAQARAITLDELAMRVNENSSRIRALTATGATLSGPRFPSLQASIALERPRRFRLVAEKTGLSGTELDLGSNDELFWFWIKRSEPPALYYCRHEQFAASAARQVLPIEPEWLIEALGLVALDPAEVSYGPSPVGNGRLRVEVTQWRPSGSRRKVLVFDELDAAVLEEHVYDEQGALVATALLSRHQRDEASGALLPRQIEIQWPSTQFAMTIRLHNLQTNQISGDPSQLWAKPEYRGWANVDLAAPGLILPPMVGPSESPPLATEKGGQARFWNRPWGLFWR
jgi:hypothetical protein